MIERVCVVVSEVGEVVVSCGRGCLGGWVVCCGLVLWILGSVCCGSGWGVVV